MTKPESTEDRPWVAHPDGKWSPRPQLPLDCPVFYGVEDGPVEFELDVEDGSIEETAPVPPSVEVVPVQPIRLSFDFKISVKNLRQMPDWSGVRRLDDLHELYAALAELQPAGSAALSPPPLVSPQEALHVPPALWNHQAKRLCSAVQSWLLEVLKNCPHSSPVHGFFCMASVSENVLQLPLAMHVSEYLGDPLDLTNFFRLSAKSIAETSRQICSMQWEYIFQEKWPVFYEALSYGPKATSEEWEVLYQQMISGKREEILEVFDREKKIGFSMSCMVAKVSWEQSSNSYVANYVSASRVLPERIPACQAHRLRFCPQGAAQEQLQPEIAPPTSSEIYAYRVLKDFNGVALGQGVELQWKMQMGSPFGWWYGRVERIERGGSGAAVTLIFPHFPTNSRWYRLRVVVGDGIIRRCGIGGYHGGIRAVTPEEEKVWMQFRPKEPITF